MLKTIYLVKNGGELRHLLMKMNSMSIRELAGYMEIDRVASRFRHWLIQAGGNRGLLLAMLTKLGPTQVHNYAQFYEPLEATARTETIFERRMLAVCIMEAWFPGCEIPVPWPTLHV